MSGTSASRGNHDSLAQGQESPLLTPALCRPCCDPGSLGWLCLSQKPTHFHGWQGAGIQMKEAAVGALMAPPALGKVGQGTAWHKGPCLPHLGLCGLSICLLTVKMDRQGALRLSNSFSIFFNNEKIVFKNCDIFLKIIWLEGREKGDTKSCNMINWRYLTGALSTPRLRNSFLDPTAAKLETVNDRKLKRGLHFLLSPFFSLFQNSLSFSFPSPIGLWSQWPLGLPFHVF